MTPADLARQEGHDSVIKGLQCHHCEQVLADLAREMSSSGLSREGDSPPQVPPTVASCSGSSSEGGLSARLDSLLMVNVNPSFSYHALVLTWSRPMILSQPSLLNPLCRKVQCSLTLVLR
ncbi:hypothetical protein E2C01_050790 [Portunus trituberculatus]|uniref:Uncharacterized protein n=1 Tax=Portunus trituberculatus TaxID=210409 RepID=A0A5B7GJX0_PORTR|nr:hypothetical protein [Portunus trituberculatus]